MKWSEALIPTLREAPKDAEATSHKLMMRAGFVRKLGSGIYSYLPLGHRVLTKVCQILREEMDRAGGLELLLPALHPAEIWKQSGRYDALGEDKISFKNRAGHEYVLGPTHEEVITELAGGYLHSYQQLPRILYQIQTKFRDELRPRFGIIRTKEFIMKDAYSFDADEKGLDINYEKMYSAYQTFFKRVGVTVDIVGADPGVMGGNVSHEFMVRSPYGEDKIAVSKGKDGDFSVSQDLARRKIESKPVKPSGDPVEAFDTPQLRTIDEMANKFKLKKTQLVKTLIYFADNKPVAVCVRGDHEVNEGKLRRELKADTLRLATSEEIKSITKAPVGFAGPVGLEGVSIVVDQDVANAADFVVGANEQDKHLRNVNVHRDFKPTQIADIRYVEEGDISPETGGPISLLTSMEVGHVFKLLTRYTKPLKALYKGQDGQERPLLMGCYGIGVNRVLAAAIEQNHDERGMCWPLAIAPYQVHLVTVNHQEDETREVADSVYTALTEAGVECLYDDREERAGVKFNDADLIGCPFQITISARNLKNDQVEIKRRQTGETTLAPKSEYLKAIQDLLSE